MNVTKQAEKLLKEWDKCLAAQPKGDVVEVQLEKDQCAPLAYNLHTLITWGNDEDKLLEIYNQFEPRLKKLKEKVVIEILQHGSK